MSSSKANITQDDLAAFAIRFNPGELHPAAFTEDGSGSYTLSKYVSKLVRPYLHDHGVDDRTKNLIGLIIVSAAFHHARAIRHRTGSMYAPGSSRTYPIIYAFGGTTEPILAEIKAGRMGVEDIPDTFSYEGDSARTFIKSLLPKWYIRQGLRVFRHPEYKGWMESKSPVWADPNYGIHPVLDAILKDDTSTPEIDALIDNDDLSEFDPEEPDQVAATIQKLAKRVEKLEAFVMLLVDDQQG